jgi:hypothetical protein
MHMGLHVLQPDQYDAHQCAKSDYPPKDGRQAKKDISKAPPAELDEMVELPQGFSL